MTSTVLLISDDPSTGALKSTLEGFGLSVQLIAGGGSSIRRSVEHRPDLLLLDCRSDVASGLQLCRSLRAVRETSDIPLIVLSPEGDHDVHLQALEAGADDCLNEYVTAREFAARFHAIRRRQEGAAGARILTYADVELDLERYKVRRGGRPVILTSMQMKLLRFLMENPTIVFSRRQLLEAVWGNGELDPGAVTACIVRLRRALNGAGGTNLIRSVPNVGYALDAEMSQAA